MQKGNEVVTTTDEMTDNETTEEIGEMTGETDIVQEIGRLLVIGIATGIEIGGTRTGIAVIIGNEITGAEDNDTLMWNRVNSMYNTSTAITSDPCVFSCSAIIRLLLPIPMVPITTRTQHH